MSIKFNRGLRDAPRKILSRLRNGGLSQKDAYLKAQRSTGTFVFIHINKCGGTSVERALDLPQIHDTARKRRDKVGPEAWARMVKFSVVRHPYAKVCSHYRYRFETGQTGLAEDGVSLNDWVHRAYGDKDPAYYNRPLRFAPCIDWLCDEDGTLLMDYVAKLETIDADWPHVQKLIGSTAALPRTNASRQASDPAAALDPRSKDIIAAHFARDFEAFGYTP